MFIVVLILERSTFSSHVDCAIVYRNEEDVGTAVRESSVKREDIFVSEYIRRTSTRPLALLC